MIELEQKVASSGVVFLIPLSANEILPSAYTTYHFNGYFRAESGAAKYSGKFHLFPSTFVKRPQRYAEM